MKEAPSPDTFHIASYRFNRKSLRQLENNLWVKNLWPLVYILSDENRKEAYVGESTNALNRLRNHLQNPQKSKLSNLHLITSDK
ncbi:MAG: GIY-YIG nuclease family protein, partial [Phaeodactylibacter sp.]|nr:GIY-YIG nuclease family protein [Phaeodactylibacter sp.]